MHLQWSLLLNCYIKKTCREIIFCNVTRYVQKENPKKGDNPVLATKTCRVCACYYFDCASTCSCVVIVLILQIKCSNVQLRVSVVLCCIDVEEKEQAIFFLYTLM